MQGRMVDIDKLRSANEAVRAVGNMSVNARGDVVGSNGKILQKKESVMKAYYNTPKGQASDAKIQTPAKDEEVKKITPVIKKQEGNVISTFKSKESSKTTVKKEEPKSGIDAALDGIE